MAIFFRPVTTTDEAQAFTLGDVCNLTVQNLSLINRPVLSSNQAGTPDVGIITPLGTLNLDQNRFSVGENNILYIRSEVAGSPCNLLVWAW